MARYHISPKNGEPDICRARKRPCPIKNLETGEVDQHFTSLQEAEQEADRRLRSKHQVIRTLKRYSPHAGIKEIKYSTTPEGTEVREYTDGEGRKRREVKTVYHVEVTPAEEPINYNHQEEMAAGKIPVGEKPNIQASYRTNREGKQERVTTYSGRREEELPAPPAPVDPQADAHPYSVSTEGEDGRPQVLKNFTETRSFVATYLRQQAFDEDKASYDEVMATRNPQELSEVLKAWDKRNPLLPGLRVEGVRS